MTIVKVLVEAGADFTIADNDGITPIVHAKNRGLDKIVQIRIQAGALAWRKHTILLWEPHQLNPMNTFI